MENNVDKINKLKHLLKIWFNKKTALKYSCLAETLQDDIENLLLDILPHGSGINCNWKFIWYDNRSLDCYNSYHAMNEGGCYVGRIPFRVKFFRHKKDILNPLKGSFKGKFKVMARKGDTGYKVYAPNCDYRSYNLRDYLQDIINYTLEGFEPYHKELI